MIGMQRPKWLFLKVLWAGLAVTTASASAALCADRSIRLQAGVVGSSSDWQEYDSRGKRLVHESGTLLGPQLSAALQCSDWEFEGAWAQLDGTRAYDGQTNSGTPVVSQSTLRQSLGHFRASYSLTDAWQFGARVSGQTTWRDIASAGGASGYPERFDWVILSVGGQWTAPLAGGRLALGAWAGSQLNSSMTLQLPGRDPSSLALGPIQQYELSLGWNVPLSQGWSIQTYMRYLATDIGQGAEAIIYRNGVPVGVARQPHTTTVDIPIGFRLGYVF